MPGVDPNSNSNRTDIPCRTCTDFKSWSKMQTAKLDAAGKTQSTTIETATKTSDQSKGCPYDKDDLGRSTWGFLHTVAASYPDNPSKEQISDMTSFFSIFSKVYPCDICAKDFRKELAKEPIVATSQHAFSQWLCRMHNKVNEKLGKPIFDCRLVNERWRDGWKDGSCD